MAPEIDPIDFLGREPDQRLLGADLEQLPASVKQPPQPLAESPARRQVVRLGATMTGVTLIGGLVVSLLGLVELIVNGSLPWVIVLVLGIVLVATHWGWVHVAELTGNRIEARRTLALEDRQKQWLAQIEPYPRWEVSTSVDQRGGVTILTMRHRPVPRDDGTYTFSREEVGRETHSADEPAAAVAERAELLRRQAAADTARAREAFEAARDAYEETLMLRDDEEQRVAALRAASEALSERINANLRDPPLTG